MPRPKNITQRKFPYEHEFPARYDYRLISEGWDEGVKTYRFELEDHDPVCPFCHKQLSKKYGKVQRIFYGIDEKGDIFKILLSFNRRICGSCGKTFFPDLNTHGQKYLKSIKNKVLEMYLKDNLSYKEISERLPIAFASVQGIIERAFKEREQKHSYRLPQTMGLFDISFHGQDFLLVIDVKKLALLDVVSPDNLENLSARDSVKDILTDRADLADNIAGAFTGADLHLLSGDRLKRGYETLVKDGVALGLKERTLRDYFKTGESELLAKMSNQSYSVLPIRVAQKLLETGSIDEISKYSGPLQHFGEFAQSLKRERLPENVSDYDIEVLTSIVEKIKKETSDWHPRLTGNRFRDKLLFSSGAQYPVEAEGETIGGFSRNLMDFEKK